MGGTDDQEAKAPGAEPHPIAITRSERWQATSGRGATLWLTGLPAAGKSTLAIGLEAALVRASRPAYRLDGDELRRGLCDDLTYSSADRAENVRRIAHLAATIAEAGMVAVVAAISPAAAMRAQARAIHQAAGLAFLEVFVDTPLSECERRDPKGLYKLARSGTLPMFTGVSDPYEAPADPDVHLRWPWSSELAVARLSALL